MATVNREEKKLKNVKSKTNSDLENLYCDLFVCRLSLLNISKGVFVDSSNIWVKFLFEVLQL